MSALTPGQVVLNTTCGICGALVADAVRHNDWHYEQDKIADRLTEVEMRQWGLSE